MLFMVIERFKPGLAGAAGERFTRQGRMLPNGVVYHASWMEASGKRCFQLMEAATPELMAVWSAHWSDLVDFEVVPVLTSKDFWAGKRDEKDSTE